MMTIMMIWKENGKNGNKKRTGRGSRYVGHRVPSFYGCSTSRLSRDRTLFLSDQVSILCPVIFQSAKPHDTRLFSPLLRDISRCFRLRSAACLRVIRFRQSGQYLTLLEADAKDTPHTLQCRLSSGVNSSAVSSRSRGRTAARNHLQSRE